jgi:DNA-binding transcriptional LysR family regulator
MMRLETIVGRKLLQRTQDGVKLTGHGELLLTYANRAIALNEETLARLRDQSASGRVRLGVGEETALPGLTPAIQRFQRTHPQVEIKLTVAGPAKLEDMLKQGKLDFMIGNVTRINSQPVVEWRSHLAWLASTDLSIDLFKTLPLVLCASTALWRDEILSSLRTAGWKWRVVFEGASLDATLSAVESGLGVSALLRETKRKTGIREVKHNKLPLLPQVRFGLFRSQTADTKARDLMETALTSSLRTAIGRAS